MNTNEFLDHLRRHPDFRIEFLLPDGGMLPAHFHITEVGHLSKAFIDCGGKRHLTQSCLLQVWVAEDVDHRLQASKLLRIFERAEGLLPEGEMPVEIECEAPVLTQLPLSGYEVADGVLRFRTVLKHTDCLAKELCLPDFLLPPMPGQKGLCVPGSACC